MKGPRGPKQEEEPLQGRHEKQRVGNPRHIVKQTGDAVSDDDNEAVEGVEVWGEGDPEIMGVRDDVATVARDFEGADPATPHPHPDGVRELVAKDIGTQRTRFAHRPDAPEKPQRPQRCAQAEKPKLVGGPSAVLY